MAPRRPRTSSDATMSQEDFRSLSELWKMAKTHGLDWVLQKLTEGPEKDPQPVTDAPPRQRKVPMHYRDSSPGLKTTTSTQPKAVAAVQVESTGQPPFIRPSGPVGDSNLGAKGQVNLYSPGPQSDASTVVGLAPSSAQPQGGPDTYQPPLVVQSTTVVSSGPSPVQMVGQVGSG
ncbi:hypothetical protein NDU88_008259 [Pleurodeles waltl]|uniref:Uncharacterized protein n=1 Tax=Pleurodeles waltl TaxID=8319 RepID=A0AAV7N968_PLEWA|nr:hypothetical protein NDU88_008259 [Pleurodeles waltl]